VIFVDTCVLSEAFRKQAKGKRQSKQVELFHQMIVDDWPIALPGIVLQEFLTGMKTEKQFERAQEVLSGFPVILADEQDHLLASRIRSQCLSKGVSAHGIDCLIASSSINRNSRLLSFDKDFLAIAKVCHLRLFQFQ
jgi:predicted nucleic acid-binding protein